MNNAQKLAAIQTRINRALASDADKWEADKQYALEDIEKIIDGEED